MKVKNLKVVEKLDDGNAVKRLDEVPPPQPKLYAVKDLCDSGAGSQTKMPLSLGMVTMLVVEFFSDAQLSKYLIAPDASDFFVSFFKLRAMVLESEGMALADNDLKAQELIKGLNDAMGIFVFGYLSVLANKTGQKSIALELRGIERYELNMTQPKVIATIEFWSKGQWNDKMRFPFNMENRT
jgi:hypothetical protein